MVPVATIFKNWYLPIQATYKLIISCGTHTTMLSEQSKRTFKFVSPKLFIIFILFFRKLNLRLKETHRALCIQFKPSDRNESTYSSPWSAASSRRDGVR